MFFDNLSEINELAGRVQCAIFVVPNSAEINIKNATVIEKDKTTISIEQIRNVISDTRTKQKTARYIVIKQAEKMTLEACNAFLKSLEEPNENYHYVLQTENLSNIIPTIRSRAEIFILRINNPLDAAPIATDEIKNLAKRMLVAKDKDYIAIMNDIVKKKDNVREIALEVLSTAIEISYKSYFKTNNQMFLKKIPKLVKTHENISANGNIKLHLVADML
ncbi:hypothetical protein IKP94_00870 [Candidatus Saccharibacteria bacterium]|nr:hypothetical protein [Candidatus Saccharibacteria bacterium]MBR6964874.1 hypothetical protein [Candidatus Saccharibacteria bacterium]